MSNLSADYISEKEVIEAIYNSIFDEKQQARAKQRKDNGSANNNFLSGALGNTRKEVAQKDITDKILQEDFETLQKFAKEDLVVALKSIYDSGKKTFYEII